MVSPRAHGRPCSLTWSAGLALTAPRTFWECLPEPEVREEIGELLSPRGTIDRDRAYSVLTEAARKTTGDEPIAALIRAPYDEEIHAGGDVLESALTRARPEQVTNLMTSLFARLAMPVYDADPRSENRLADAQNVSKMIAGLGRRFQPDVHALFQVYQSFLPVSARFWMEWLETMKAQEGLNISKEMPSWFPMHEGELAVTRQLEWTLSRPGMNVLLKGLNQSLTSNNPGDRWAAAHLIEGAVRYAREDHPPSFGGGSGPPDVVPPSVARFTPTRVGTTPPDRAASWWSPVHPHARGDNPDALDAYAAPYGSPPRAWGQLESAATVEVIQRFTPTRVGTTRA